MTEPTGHITGLDHVQIEAPAGCEAAARAFFGGVLGLPERHKPEALRGNGGVWFGLPGGQQLHVGVVADFAPRRKGHIALRCADLEAMCATLHAAGIGTVADHEAGVARAFLSDPWGNRLELVQGQHGSRMLDRRALDRMAE